VKTWAKYKHFCISTIFILLPQVWLCCCKCPPLVRGEEVYIRSVKVKFPSGKNIPHKTFLRGVTKWVDHSFYVAGTRCTYRKLCDIIGQRNCGTKLFDRSRGTLLAAVLGVGGESRIRIRKVVETESHVEVLVEETYLTDDCEFLFFWDCHIEPETPFHVVKIGRIYKPVRFHIRVKNVHYNSCPDFLE